ASELRDTTRRFPQVVQHVVGDRAVESVDRPRRSNSPSSRLVYPKRSRRAAAALTITKDVGCFVCTGPIR
ncbi:MAG TPA: hypothetical protein VGK49_01645, partial [Ilumatobacteraceae bacterium]